MQNVCLFSWIKKTIKNMFSLNLKYLSIQIFLYSSIITCRMVLSIYKKKDICMCAVISVICKHTCFLIFLLWWGLLLKSDLLDSLVILGWLLDTGWWFSQTNLWAPISLNRRDYLIYPYQLTKFYHDSTIRSHLPWLQKSFQCSSS